MGAGGGRKGLLVGFAARDHAGQDQGFRWARRCPPQVAMATAQPLKGVGGGRWKALGVRGRGQAGPRGWLGAAASGSWSQGEEFGPAVGVGRTSGTRAPAGGPCPALWTSAASQPVCCTPQLLLGRSRDSSGLFRKPLALPALRSSLPVLHGPPGRGHSWRSAAVTRSSVPVGMTSGGRGGGWLSSRARGPAPRGGQADLAQVALSCYPHQVPGTSWPVCFGACLAPL